MRLDKEQRTTMIGNRTRKDIIIMEMGRVNKLIFIHIIIISFLHEPPPLSSALCGKETKWKRMTMGQKITKKLRILDFPTGAFVTESNHHYLVDFNFVSIGCAEGFPEKEDIE